MGKGRRAKNRIFQEITPIWINDHFIPTSHELRGISKLLRRLGRRLGIEGVVEVMRRGRLRWFGHVERKEVDDWVSACRIVEVASSRGRGRPRMTWKARLDGDMKDMGLRPEIWG